MNRTTLQSCHQSSIQCKTNPSNSSDNTYTF